MKNKESKEIVGENTHEQEEEDEGGGKQYKDI